MDKINLEDVFAVKNDGDDVLGKILYCGLGNPLIERESFVQICKDLNLPIALGGRLSDIDAFRSAVSDTNHRIVDTKNGEIRIRKIYCRENNGSENIKSRELICETLRPISNEYKKLANIYYRKDDDSFEYTIENHGTSIDVARYCDEAQKRFELYKVCVGRNQFENLVDSYIEKMDGLKINIHGKVYFIPKKNIGMVDVFEDFIECINANNKRIISSQLNVNSLFVADNSKQRGKIASEFCHSVRQEIKHHTKYIEKIITSNSTSAILYERWINKANSLQDKKKEYEELLRSELTELDDDYDTLHLLIDELKLRVKRIRDIKNPKNA